MTDAGPALGRVDALARWVAIGMSLVLLIVVARVVQLQTAPGTELVQHAGDRVASRPVQGYRGEILDRRGRLLSTSRLGFRAFIDPERVDRESVDALIVALAEATGADAATVGERLVRALQTNDERRTFQASRPTSEVNALDQLAFMMFGDDGPPDGPDPVDASPGPIRYVAVGPVLSDEQAERVRGLDMPGVYLERRPVREYPSGDLVASLLGKVGFENRGLMGAELALDAKLQASDGLARYVRDASGRPLWIERGQWVAAEHGQHQRLAIDLEMQRIAQEELSRGMEDADAAGGRLVMLDPLTGELLAMLDLYRDVGDLPEFPWAPEDADAPPAPQYDRMTRYRAIPQDARREIHPALGRNRCVEDIYEPGSTFKPFVWSLVLESGLVGIEEVFDTEGGRWRNERGRRFEDVTKRATMTWHDVLVNSSNIGMVKGSSRMDHSALRTGVRRFGFGTQTGVPLPGESGGRVTGASQWTDWTHESVASGYEVAVTPIQLARAYCAFARQGEFAGTIPNVKLVASDIGDLGDALIRALPADVATTTRRTLRPVAMKVEEKMARFEPSEEGWRYQMWGKSGTAKISLGAAPEGKRLPRGMRGYLDRQYNSSFVAGAPLERPRLVVVVVIDDPGPEAIGARRHYGSSVAGPVARRVLERCLTYLGVEPDVEPDSSDPPSGQMALAH